MHIEPQALKTVPRTVPCVYSFVCVCVCVFSDTAVLYSFPAE